MLKSALKKSSTGNDACAERRRVTFCKSVKVFTYPAITILADHDDSDSSGDEAKPEAYDENVDDPQDFLVHKVFYEEDYDKPPDEAQDSPGEPVESDTIVYYPYESETELQEFVVHCVSLLEERKESKVAKENNNCGETVTLRTRALSVENLEQHNKLTESKIRLDTFDGDKPVNAEIILSPPLQELSIDRFIGGAQAEEWFENLDISPLNSVQETDSDSNISSEDTMIMMTTEECEKNEQRIQESLLKFESLKKLNNYPIVVTTDIDKLSLNDEIKLSQNSSIHSKSHDHLSLANSSARTEDGLLKIQTKSSESISVNVDERDEAFSCAAESNETATESKDETKSEYIQGHDGLEENENVVLDDSLINMQIPQDVRDWKIELTECVSDHSVESANRESFASLESYEYKHIHNNLNSFEGASISLPECSSDELENFVDQCTERIERIKKRYSLTENSTYTPRRGIRPRFGSTVQILQQIQNEKHTSLPNPHYSWPYYTPTNLEQEGSSLSNSRTDLLDRCLGDTAQDMLMSSEQDTCMVDLPKSSERNQETLLPSQRRNIPGSSQSPPQVSTESLLDDCNQNQTSHDTVIYYSMKV